MLNDGVELAAADRAEERRALDQIVARDREQAALRRAGDSVSRAPDALQQRRDAVRRSDLADQIDVPDVDAELERRGGHQRAQLAGLQPRFSVEPLVLREAAVMRGDGLLAEPLAEMPRQPLRQPPRVDEDQRGAVRLDQRREAVVVLLPTLRAT